MTNTQQRKKNLFTLLLYHQFFELLLLDQFICLFEHIAVLVARDLWDMSDFMKLYNKNSDVFKKAYELVKEKKFEELMIK